MFDPDDLRLTMDNSSLSLPYEGRVEVYYTGAWRGICDDGWDLNDAKVVCRQLGFPDAVEATNGTLVGNGSSLTQLTNVQCNGSEEHLRGECPFSEMEADQNCSHGEAGVICQGIYIDTYRDQYLSNVKVYFAPSLACLKYSLLCLSLALNVQ